MNDRRRTSCTVCGLSRAGAAKGECAVPMPAPQPPDCLMVTLEREALASAGSHPTGGCQVDACDCGHAYITHGSEGCLGDLCTCTRTSGAVVKRTGIAEAIWNALATFPEHDEQHILLLRSDVDDAVAELPTVDAIYCEHTEQVRNAPTNDRWWCDPLLPRCPGPHWTLGCIARQEQP